MDELLIALSDVSVKLLPILGAAVLIVLIFVLKKTLDLLTKVEKTLDTVDQTLKKIEAPINTLVGIAKAIDTVSSASEHLVRTLITTIAGNFKVITAWLKSVFNKPEPPQTDETTEEELGL
jgi:hypothetical protein